MGESASLVSVRRLWLGALLFGASLLSVCALATGAVAATFCVNKPSCVGTAKATIQEALVAAELNGVTDTVEVGANGGKPYVEKLSYTDAAETVHIVGDGPGETIVEPPGVEAVTVTLLSPSSSIAEMTIVVPDVSNGTALRWNGTASGILAVHDGSTATETVGMKAEGGAVLEDSVVSVRGFGLFTFASPAGAKILRSTVSGSGGGITVTTTGSFTIERSNVIAGRTAIEVGSGQQANVYNSVVRRTGGLAGDAAVTVFSGGEAVLRHVTMIGAGAGVAGSGVNVDATSNDATATVFSSIIEGFDFALVCAGGAGKTATLGVSYSNFTDPTSVADPECAETLSNDTAVDPEFVSPGSLIPIYRLKATSPLIDAGEPADPLAVDFAGDPRVVDGDGVGGARSDVGAFEYQRQAPVAKAAAEPAAVGIGEVVEFSAKGSNDPDPGDALTYSWNFGDGTEATGLTAQHSYASGGEVIATLTVTDPTGLQATANATVVVTGPGDGGGEATAKITKLRAVPRRIARGKGAPKLLRGAHRGLRFRITGPAPVALQIARCKGASGCNRKAWIRKTVRFNAPAGVSTIRFRGRFAGRLLPAGRYRATLAVIGHGNRRGVGFVLLP